MLIDTHAHLDLITRDDSELNRIIDICKKEQLKYLFNISVDFEGNLRSVELSKAYPEVYFSVGIHPSEADKVDFNRVNDLKRHLSDKKCIGIGEIGIDLYRNYSKFDNQVKVFKCFLQLAKEYNKPVIIHSRQAFQEAYDIITKPEYKEVQGVFHCFSYEYEQAKMCIDQGYKISFTGNLTFKNAHNLHETAKKIPLEHIFLETDSPYLTPVPFRGKRNYPYYIKHIYEYLSQLRCMELDILKEQIYKNVTGFFSI